MLYLATSCALVVRLISISRPLPVDNALSTLWSGSSDLFHVAMVMAVCHLQLLRLLLNSFSLPYLFLDSLQGKYDIQLEFLGDRSVLNAHYKVVSEHFIVQSAVVATLKSTVNVLFGGFTV